MDIRVGLIDLRSLRQLAIRLERSRLVGVVLEDDVALLILVVTKRQQDDVALVDPDLLAELATDVGEATLTVEAERLETPVPKHLDNLSVLLSLLLEGQLALLIVVFVLSATTVFTTLEACKRWTVL